MAVWIEVCFVRARDPINFITYARCYEYLISIDIFSYIVLSIIQLVILVACIKLWVRDIKRRGGACVNFLHSHQAIILMLCSVFSVGKLIFY